MTEIFKEMILYLQDVLWFLSKDKYRKCFSEMVRGCFLVPFTVCDAVHLWEVGAELKECNFYQVAGKWVCP